MKKSTTKRHTHRKTSSAKIRKLKRIDRGAINIQGIGFLIVGILAAILVYAFINKTSFLATLTTLNPIASPFDVLSSSLTKTTAANSLHMDFKTKVATRISSTKTGVTQTLNNNINGYITGTDDESKAELQISSDKTPDSSVTMNMITLKNKDTYIKTFATGGKWIKMTKDDLEKQSEKTPTDASLYGFQFLANIFTKEKPIFKTIKKETVEKVDDMTLEGKTYKGYSVELSVPEYIEAIGKNPNTTEKDKKDAKLILADATIKLTFYIDSSTSYIKELVIDAKNLTQIQTPQTEPLGISARHDMHLTGVLSGYNIPVEVKAPPPQDVIGPDTQI